MKKEESTTTNDEIMSFHSNEHEKRVFRRTRKFEKRENCRKTRKFEKRVINDVKKRSSLYRNSWINENKTIKKRSTDNNKWKKRFSEANCWLSIVDCWRLIADDWLLIVDCWRLIAIRNRKNEKFKKTFVD